MERDSPVTTFVTAFFDLREDRGKDKSPSRCFSLFGELANTGIPIHAFVSRSYEGLLPPLPTTTTVEWLELEDLRTFAAISSTPALRIPATATPHHDTRNFHCIMNAKPELVARVIQSGFYSTPQYAWIDFSIFHIVKDRPATIQRLHLLAHTRFKPGVHIPGCWQRGAQAQSLLAAVNWRFCGGFFLGDVDSLKHFYTKSASTLKSILAQGHLVWEVNVWHRLELTGAWSPQWYGADHSDSMFNIPMNQAHVVACLTTIPSRLPEDCRRAIDSVIHQVDEVLLGLPTVYRRFGATPAIPSWLLEPPYLQKVRRVPLPDYGPATKYMVSGAAPKGAWILTIDDDQVYAANMVQTMLGAVRSLAVYQNHYGPIRQKTSGGLIHGYVGNLAPKALLAGLASFPLPEAARFVDDQWLSIFCFKMGIPILPTPLEQYSQIYGALQNGHELLGRDSLSGLNNRDEKVRELEREFGICFGPGPERWNCSAAS
jgi:hypothetical protein